MNPVDQLWVVVPAYNEAKRLPTTLAALAEQTDQDFTLCIVDNASTDATAAIAEGFARSAPFPVVVLGEPDKGVGCAVDTGFRHAIAEGATLIARTDADTVVARDWVDEIRQGFTGGAELLIGTMTARRDESSVLTRAAFRSAVALAAFFGRVRPTHRDGHDPYQMHAGFNMAITTELYLRSGGMPRRPSPTDRAFMNRVRAVGGVVRRHPSMKAATSLRRFGALGVIGTARWYLDRGASIEDPR